MISFECSKRLTNYWIRFLCTHIHDLFNADDIERSSEDENYKLVIITIKLYIITLHACTILVYENALERLRGVYAKQSNHGMAYLKDHNLEYVYAIWEKFVNTSALFWHMLHTCARDLFSPAPGSRDLGVF